MIRNSLGVLRYINDNRIGYKLIVEIDQDICDFYRHLIPKWYDIRPQKYPAHISVVRHEAVPKLEYWGKYEGELIDFCYDTEIQRDKVYWWLNVNANRLCEIRLELGLSQHSKFSRPPDGTECFHTTIGNCK